MTFDDLNKEWDSYDRSLVEKPLVHVYLRKIRLNKGGYDRAGQYFGNGIPLYHYEFEFERVWKQGNLRQSNREDAKSLVRHWYPNFTLKFFKE